MDDCPFTGHQHRPRDERIELSERMPDLGALHLLLSVERLGSLGAAAVEHGISQPAASSRIRYMERLTGLPLLLRGARGSALTPEGETLARWAVDLLSHAATVDSGLAAMRRTHEVQLCVAASTTIARFLLPSWLAAGQARFPTVVSVQAVNSTLVMEKVLSGAASLGFIEGPGTRHGLEDRVVATDRLVLVVGPDHPWASRREPVSGRELADTRLLQREAGSGTREALEAALAHLAPMAPAAWETSSTKDLLAAAARGQAPAVLSALAVESGVRRGRLVPVATAGLHLGRRLRAVWPLGQPLGRTQRDFLSIAGPVLRDSQA